MKQKTRRQDIIIILLATLLAAFGVFYSCFVLADAHFAESYGQKATATSEAMPEYRFTEKTAPDLYRISPRFDTGLTGSTFTVTVHYKTNTTLPLYWATIMDYDAALDSFPMYACATLAKEANEVTFTLPLEKQEKCVYFMLDLRETTADIEITSIEIESKTLYAADRPVLSLFFVLLAGALAAHLLHVVHGNAGSAEKKERIFVACALAAVFVAASLLLFTKNAVYGHDAIFHFNRVQSIAEAISSGQIPHRSGTGFNNGYGYMNSAFYPELFLYIPALLICLGCSMYVAFKVFWLLVVLAGVLAAYYAFAKMAKGRLVGLGVSALYACSLYRLQNLYVRCAVGEVLFLCFLPLVMYGIYNILYEEKKNWVLLAVGCTCVLQSHILGTAMTAALGAGVILGGIIELLCKKKSLLPALKQFAMALVAVLCLNSWFLVPMLYYMRHDFQLFAQVEGLGKFFGESYVVPLGELFSLWPTPRESGIIVSLGVTVWGAALVAAVYLAVLRFGKKQRAANWAAAVTAVLFGITTMLATNMKLWAALVKMNVFASIAATLQFPFRFVGPLVFLACLFICLAAARLAKGKAVKITCAALLGLALFSAVQYYTTATAANSERIDEAIEADTNLWYSTESVPEYLLACASSGNETPVLKKVRGNEEVTVTAYEKDRTRITFSFTNTGEDSYLDVPMMYYKGYHAYDVDTGEELPVVPGENGIIRVQLGARQSGSVLVRYKDNIFFVAANILSLASAVAVAWYVVAGRKRQKPKIPAAVAAK